MTELGAGIYAEAHMCVSSSPICLSTFHSFGSVALVGSLSPFRQPILLILQGNTPRLVELILSPETSNITLDLGLETHANLTLSEARSFVSQRITVLEK